MTAYYPTIVKTFVNKVDFTDTILADHVNSLQDEVNALEVNLGTYIRTSSGWVGAFDRTTSVWNTLKDRLANIEYGLSTAFDAVPPGGTTGQVLVKCSGSDYATSWSNINALPSFTNNAGKYLTNDGTSASWSVVEQQVSPLLLIGA